MKKLIRRFREWRDRCFRERIDRVYFRCDKQGNRFLCGNFRVVKDPVTAIGGNLAVSRDVWIVGDAQMSGSVVAGGDIIGGVNQCPDCRTRREAIRVACEGPAVVRQKIDC